RGIIHRDLKPDNVMLGEFGEVYLLDWGIAVSTRPEDDRGLPNAGTATRLAGTPAYMAPEMLDVDKTMDARTDVYLLGAILHEIVTGKPPHDGKTLYEVLRSAFHPAPISYDTRVPRELAAICTKAMRAAADDRYPTADALRRAIAEHLEHRASIALCRETRARLQELERRVASRTETSEDRNAEIHRRFVECRFGFEQALLTWPESEDAASGLESAIVAMLDFELESRNARAATLLLRELRAPTPTLVAQVDTLTRQLREEGEEYARLRAFVRDLDVRGGAKARAAFLVAIGVLWAIGPVVLAILERKGVVDIGITGRAIGIPVAFTASIAIGAYVGRTALLQSTFNRRFVMALIVVGLSMLLDRSLTLLIHGNLAEAIVRDVVALAIVAAMASITIDARIWPAALVFVAFSIVGALHLDYAQEVLSTSSLVAFTMVLLAWRRMERASILR
ncbi:MAG: serine/threonine protein kinase, partial [Polyangiales bacterium]